MPRAILTHDKANSMKFTKDDFCKVVGNRFKCDFQGCGKIFQSRSILTRHVRVHTGEKPYVCSVCNKGFTQVGNMTKHERSHETSHLRWNRHTQLKPFPCPFPGCEKSFTAKSSLRVHYLNAHNESEIPADLYEKESECSDHTSTISSTTSTEGNVCVMSSMILDQIAQQQSEWINVCHPALEKSISEKTKLVPLQENDEELYALLSMDSEDDDSLSDLEFLYNL